MIVNAFFIAIPKTSESRLLGDSVTRCLGVLLNTSIKVLRIIFWSAFIFFSE